MVAGAGTGKISTIIGKARYIKKKGLAEPSEILLLSFAQNVKKELEERVRKSLNAELPIETFHSFGLSIIGIVEHGIHGNMNRIICALQIILYRIVIVLID